MGIIEIKESDSYEQKIRKINTNFNELLKLIPTRGELIDIIDGRIEDAAEED